MYQNNGIGANAVLEAYLAAGDTLFGKPLASSVAQTFTTCANTSAQRDR